LGSNASIPEDLDFEHTDSSYRVSARSWVGALDAQALDQGSPLNAVVALYLRQGHRPTWSQSWMKRFFDCICVLFALPVMIPVAVVIALAVRLTSSGPVLFLQKRMGREGRQFTILKFRTLAQPQTTQHHAVTTAVNQRFTPVGPFLRRWKLDELPQLLNVLVGDMSLVGARPKLPQHQFAELVYRPGITGAATVVFAREELLLATVPKDKLDSYYRAVILPAKHALDDAYMKRATFLSDLKLLVDSLLHRWDISVAEGILRRGTQRDK
jgi:lipopolysaccharide/colanic/teichoic acid biosynthesis glycosyltransferase